jgi:tetratricopeptide (TPR) repeat protein
MALTIATSGLQAADTGWPVEKALLRFEAQIAAHPSEPRAGILAILPDGGLLPSSPEPAVTDAHGKPLKCEVVWHNPASGLGIVFEPPAAGGDTVAIYLRNGKTAPVAFGPNAAFYPSLLLYTRSGDASLEAAERMGRAAPPGGDALLGQVSVIGHRENPFGSDDSYISYYVGWLKIEKAARIYFCTVSDDGSDFLLDGKSVASWPGLHNRFGGQRGQYGNWVNVSEGLHKVEYVHFKKQGDPEAHALWMFPGKSATTLPDTIPASAYIRSGSAELIKAAFPDGRPVAAFSANPVSYLWLGAAPVNLFRFQARFADSNPAEAAYAWTLGDRTPTNREFSWLIEGHAVVPAALTVSAPQGSARCVRQISMASFPSKASVDNAYDRKQYREALTAMCKAASADKKPCADWSADIWTTLIAAVEPYKGGAVLLDIFNRSFEDVCALKPEERWYLEDCFFEILRVIDPAGTPKWIDRLERQEKERARKFHWKLARIDFTFYDRNDLAEARKLVNELRAAAGMVDETALSQIRQGDIEREAGNIAEATKLYSAAQDRYREHLRLKSLHAGARRGTAGLARSREEWLKQRAPSKPALTPLAAPPTSNWKTFAVRESSFFTEMQNFLRQGFFFEARDILHTWELEFPLSKLSGEYPLAEAMFYLAVERYDRALRILRLYRKGVDISSSMPQALALELDGLEKLDRKAEAVELAQDILKRLPYHPLAERAERIVKASGAAPAREEAEP